jgi:hypothetical protein
VRTTFSGVKKTLDYYLNGVKNLLKFEPLASPQLEAITTEMITAYATYRLAAGLESEQCQPPASGTPAHVHPCARIARRG